MSKDSCSPRACLGHPDAGFTLIELLVVVLIIGTLAAIALPTFLAQGKKSSDSVAKSDARNLVSFVESCFATENDYTNCDTESELESIPFTWGTAPGDVSVTAATTKSYTVQAVARVYAGGSPHTFTIKRLADGSVEHDCTTGSPGNDEGGCNGGTW